MSYSQWSKYRSNSAIPEVEPKNKRFDGVRSDSNSEYDLANWDQIKSWNPGYSTFDFEKDPITLDKEE